MNKPSPITRLGVVTALVLAPAVGAPATGARAVGAPAPQPPGADQAPIALLIDLPSGQTLHSRDEKRRFLPASMTKVMTAFVAFEMLKSGDLRADQTFTVRADIAREWSGKGSTMFLKAGQQISLRQLLLGITTVSANDGCIVLANGASGSVEQWVQVMNGKARELGMFDSHFGTPNGWPDEGRTYSSAKDFGTLAQAIFQRHPQLYREYFGHRRFAHDGLWQENHDPITGRLAGADGIKTGFTREAGYNFLGSAQRGARRLVMVVAGTQSGPERAQISRDYLEWGFATFQSRNVFKQGSQIGHARVQDGNASSVPLLAAHDINVSLADFSAPQLELSITYAGPLTAPIAPGQTVAQLQISGPEIESFSVPLVAGARIAKANFWHRLSNGLKGVFS